MLGYVPRKERHHQPPLVHPGERTDPLELLDTGLNTKEIEVITMSNESVEAVPKTEEVVAVFPKIKDSVEMVAKPMSQESGVRVRYVDLE